VPDAGADTPAVAGCGSTLDWAELGVGYPTAMPLAQAGFLASGATGGSTEAGSDHLRLFPTYQYSYPAPVDCWLRSDGAWLYVGGSTPCNEVIHPGHAIRYSHLPTSGFTWAVPKPYSNP